MRDCSHLFESDVPEMAPLAADCSFRRYYRFQDQGHSCILMDAPVPENPAQFCRVADFLKMYKISTPHILRQDLDQGFLVLEDFGDNTFSRMLDKGYDAKKLYHLALDVLIHLHKSIMAAPDFLPPLSSEKLLLELDLFLTWYWPDYIGASLSEDARDEFFEIWQDLFDVALAVPQSIVLKDFHVDNLMLLDRTGLGACGVLDFQDALWGPVVYDVISLLEDERRDMSPALYQELWQKYVKAFPLHSAEELTTSAMILGAARHIKNLGVFARMNARYNKPQYMQHFPRMWRHIYQNLEHPSLADVKAWLEAHVPTTN